MRRIALLVVVAACCAPVALASSGVHVRSVDAAGYPLMHVTMVAPLGSAAPRLTENGRAVVGYSAVNLGATKSIVLALDRSQSMKGKPLARTIAAAQAFISVSRPDDNVGVVAFGSSALALTRDSSSAAAARDQLGALTVDPKSGTALYDAVVLAAGRLEAEERPGRAIVVVTDGQDVSSLSTLSDAIAAARRARAAVYAIGISGPSFTPYALRRLSSATGGSFHRAASAAGLDAVYTGLRDELARTWQLSYLTSAAAGSTVALTASVPGQGSSHAQAAMPSPSGAAVDAPSPVIPSIGYGSAGTILIGLTVGALLLLASFFWFAASRGNRVQARIEPHLGAVVKNGKARRRASRDATRTRFADAVERTLANVKQFRQVEKMIERADLPLRPGELLGLCVGIALLVGFVGVVSGASPIIALILMVLGFGAPLGVVSYKAAARIRKFENQLPDLLITLAASLKAGHSFRQGIQSVVEEGAEPASKEFGRVMSETQLGKPIDAALAHMAERVDSKNFTFVINAVTIQRQIGGSLSGLFDMVAETVRQRQQFARKVKSLTAMGRMSAYVLVGLPFFIGAIVTLLNPLYMSPLYHTALGQKLIMGSLVMIAFGSLMLKRIASFRG